MVGLRISIINYEILYKHMEFKLFGKKIFEVKKNKVDTLVQNSNEALDKSKFLPDFYTMRDNESSFGGFVSVSQTFSNADSSTGIVRAIGGAASEIPKETSEKKDETLPSPKKVFELKLLNDESFKINIDPVYVDAQIESFKDKLALIKASEFDMGRGANEIASVLIRLQNRKKYATHEKYFDDYAYTTTTKIKKVLSENGHLRLGKVEQFIADMPLDAIYAMKTYTQETETLCSKRPVFYIIADQKDFKKTDERRDPILLAQSPFGHFWQILGAWDEEMMFLEEL